MDVAVLAMKVDSRTAKTAKTDLDNLTGGADRAENAVIKLGEASNRSSHSMRGFAASSRNVMASLGKSHQLRSTAVQFGQVTQSMAAGTSFGRALSIQLTDILLPLGTFGALAGVAAGAMAPMIAGMFDAESKGRALEKTLDQLAASTDAYAQAAKSASTTTIDLVGQYGVAAEKARELFVINKDLAKLDALAALKASTVELTAHFGDLSGKTRLGMENLGQTVANTRDWIEQLKQSMDGAGQYEVNQLNTRILNLEESLNGLGAGINVLESISNTLNVGTREAGVFAGALAELQNAASLQEQAAAMDRVVVLFRQATGATSELNVEQQRLLRSLIDASLAAVEIEATTTDVTAQTNAWSGSMAGVKAEVDGILSALSAIGGGVISNAAKTAEIEALRAGKSIREASVEAKRVAKEFEFAAKEAAASNIFEKMAVSAERYQFEAGLALDVTLDKERQAARERDRLLAKSGAGSASALVALQKEISQRTALLGLTGDQRKKLEAVYQVQQRLGKEASKLSRTQISGYADQLILLEEQEAAMQRVVEQQRSWADEITRAIFEGENLGETIKNMLRQIAIQFASSRIVLPIIASVTGVQGLNALVGAGQGGGGLLGSLLGGGGGAGGLLAGTATGTFLSGVGGGFQAALGLGGYSSAGLFSVGANAAAASAATGAGAFAASIGAVAAPLLAVAAAFSFFKKRVKELDAGLRVTIDGLETSVETFRKLEIRRFWGLSKKRRTEFSVAGAEIDDPIGEAVHEVQQSILAMAGILNVGESAFKDFAATIQFSTKDLTEEQIAEELQKQLIGVSDSMAELVLGSEEFILKGESATQTLQRMTTHLEGANSQLDVLGLRLFDVSVAGAGAASQFVQLFGSLENFNQFAGSYYQNFYSAQERFDYSLNAIGETLKSLGFSTIPATHAQFRMLVQGLSEMGHSEGVAELLKLAPAFDEIVKAMTSSVRDSVNKTKSILDVLDRAFSRRVDAWDEKGARARALRLIQSGDVSDQRRLEGAITTLSGASTHLFGSYVEYARDYGRITAAIKTLRDETATQLTTEEKTLAALEQSLGIQNIQADLLSSIDGTLVTLSTDLVAVQKEFARAQKLESLQKELGKAMAGHGDAPEVLRIVQEVARGGSLFRDHASYVTLSDGRSFSSKQGGPTEELAQARRQAMTQIAASQQAYDAWSRVQQNKIEPLRAQIRELGGIPQFASGGAHMGGWRVVGERGWELEHTGPSRVVSNSDARSMLDNREVVRAIEALREEMREFKEDNHNGHFQIAKSTGISARLARKTDQLGMKTYQEEPAS